MTIVAIIQTISLVAANRARFHQRWGFSIKILKWKFFLEVHMFATTNSTSTN
jgi:hypothetical protein